MGGPGAVGPSDQGDIVRHLGKDAIALKVVRILTDLCLDTVAKIVNNPLTPIDQTTGLLLRCKK